MPETRLCQAALGAQFLLFAYSLPVISYAAAIITRQKSVPGRLLAVWNYANVASIGQHICPISWAAGLPGCVSHADPAGPLVDSGNGGVGPYRARTSGHLDAEPLPTKRLRTRIRAVHWGTTGGWRRVERNLNTGAPALVSKTTAKQRTLQMA